MRIVTAILALALMTNVATSYQLPIGSHTSKEPRGIFPTIVRYDSRPRTPLVPRPDMTEVQFGLLELDWTVYLKHLYANLATEDAEMEPQSETEWCKFLAPKYGALVEYRLFDNTRVDLLNSKYAIEADWAHKSLKWAEAIGQAAWYAQNTRKQPAVLLLVKNRSRTTMNNVYRCRAACQLYNITLFVEDLSKYKLNLTPLLTLPKKEKHAN